MFPPLLTDPLQIARMEAALNDVFLGGWSRETPEGRFRGRERSVPAL